MPDRGQRISYQVPPDVQDIVVWPATAQVYVVASTRPYTRRGGDPSYVITWATCCSTCGERFTFTTGLAGYLSARRCQVHRPSAKKYLSRYRNIKGRN